MYAIGGCLYLSLLKSDADKINDVLYLLNCYTLSGLCQLYCSTCHSLFTLLSVQSCGNRKEASSETGMSVM